jgi:hypothetical protein
MGHNHQAILRLDGQTSLDHAYYDTGGDDCSPAVLQSADAWDQLKSCYS